MKKTSVKRSMDGCMIPSILSLQVADCTGGSHLSLYKEILGCNPLLLITHVNLDNTELIS